MSIDRAKIRALLKKKQMRDQMKAPVPKEPEVKTIMSEPLTKEQVKAGSSGTKVKGKLAELLAKKKAREAKEQATSVAQLEARVNKTTRDVSGIVYNEEQNNFVTLMGSGQSCVLIGSAGTGKTTCSKGGINKLIQSGIAGVLVNDGNGIVHKYLTHGTPSIVIISFTRRATDNIRNAQDAGMKKNCLTGHKLLEFQPTEKFVEDPETGELKKKKVFEPKRNSSFHLPDTINTIVVEEASMLDTEFVKLILDALGGRKVQWVFIGDLNQLPPVFGDAILGHMINHLPVVELTQVYRQALESPIIRLAHRILSGKVIRPMDLESWNVENKLTMHVWKQELVAERAAQALIHFFKGAYDAGAYDYDEDIVLIPYNKQCGTIELNKGIANFIARAEGRVTYEIVAGYDSVYFSVGDKVMIDKEDAIITEINPNQAYLGRTPQPASLHLDYWGTNQKPDELDQMMEHETDIDAMLASFELDRDERKLTASHKIKVRMLASDVEVEISAASKIKSMELGYALTIHRSQGSEWRKVFLCLHKSHGNMLNRELLYTGVTRAKEELYCICEKDSFVKGIQTQAIKGNDLETKAKKFAVKDLPFDIDLI